MSKLLPLPKPPKGVTFNLKCPSSVLYRDLSFHGNSSNVFRRVYGFDYSMDYVVYDAAELRWDISYNNPFNCLLSPELNAVEVAQKFITTTSRNARQLVHTAQIVSSPTRWRKSHLKKDLLEDLNLYWDAYENHTTCLYPFWGVETLLTNSLIDELTKSGFQEEVDKGLPTFAVPSEPNWFTLEQQNLAILKSRFDGSYENKTTFDAATHHADTFGFMSVIFNIGTPPSTEDIITKMKQISEWEKSEMQSLDNFPKNIVKLGDLFRELAFWKNERQDAFALADTLATPMYKAVSELLKISIDLIYSMTRDEITKALTGEEELQLEEIKKRSTKYCRALINDTISFYEPTINDEKKEEYVFKEGDVIQGASASPGIVRGKVKIVALGEENPIIQPDEIIVTSMTRPELGAALDVALAYVTDEGGRLCHAAIVSREKKKPCIVGARLCHAAIVAKAKGKPCVVGTRKATEVLRNGMLIEVDGSKGIVTVL